MTDVVTPWCNRDSDAIDDLKKYIKCINRTKGIELRLILIDDSEIKLPKDILSNIHNRQT